MNATDSTSASMPTAVAGQLETTVRPRRVRSLHVRLRMEAHALGGKGPVPALLLEAANDVERFRDWIQAHGEQHDVCTRNVLDMATERVEYRGSIKQVLHAIADAMPRRMGVRNL